MSRTKRAEPQRLRASLSWPNSSSLYYWLTGSRREHKVPWNWHKNWLIKKRCPQIDRRRTGEYVDKDMIHYYGKPSFSRYFRRVMDKAEIREGLEAWDERDEPIQELEDEREAYISHMDDIATAWLDDTDEYAYEEAPDA